ncbi:MAG: hypothetical protein OJF50_001573 [Nitrospira sp.]|nr:hypothetical protein [Nitrospira sp.]
MAMNFSCDGNLGEFAFQWPEHGAVITCVERKVHAPFPSCK